MSKPSEHKTVQARILEYAEAIGWTFVSQKAVCRRDLNRRERRERNEDLEQAFRFLTGAIRLIVPDAHTQEGLFR